MEFRHIHDKYVYIRDGELCIGSESDVEDLIVRATKLKGQLGCIISLIADAREELKSQSNAKAKPFESRREKVIGEITEREAKIEDLKNAFGYGEIGKDEFCETGSAILNNIKALESEKIDLASQIYEIRAYERDTQIRIDKLENICNEVAKLVKDPDIYFTLGDNVPFECLDGIITDLDADSLKDHANTKEICNILQKCLDILLDNFERNSDIIE